MLNQVILSQLRAAHKKMAKLQLELDNAQRSIVALRESESHRRKVS